ncbi:MAG: DUF1460 domain-containing protein [Gemmatimonadaceae bacterium]|nr:DUF1460 domain-containing protein [Gemmatimonadaceae bacterium]
MDEFGRREFLRRAGALGLAVGALPLEACLSGNALPSVDPPGSEDLARLGSWSASLHEFEVRTLQVPDGIGIAAAKVGTLAIGTPYEAFTLERYLKQGGDARKKEPLTLSLTRFDCVTLVESAIAVARASRKSVKPAWNQFAREIEQMRYRGGERDGFASRLHYFSEWISDGQKRGLVRDLGKELGGVNDARPLRFMTEHRASYPGLRDDSVFGAIGAIERSLDTHPRYVIPTNRIEGVSALIRSGDVLAFATSIPGLDVSHAAFAYRDGQGVLRVLHAPLSGGSVEISQRTLPEYVGAIKRSTGILVARPLA